MTAISRGINVYIHTFNTAIKYDNGGAVYAISGADLIYVELLMIQVNGANMIAVMSHVQ